MMKNTKTTNTIFENPKTKKKLWMILWFLVFVSLFLEFFVHRKSHFGDNGIDGYMGFFAMLGFGSCFVFFVVVKLLSFILKREEDYYDK